MRSTGIDLAKTVFLLILAVLPWQFRRLFYTHVFGWEIGRECYVGHSLLLCEHLCLGDGARIGHFNIIRGAQLKLEKCSNIGNFNRIIAVPLRSTKHFREQTDRLPQLLIGEHSSITSRHFIDCSAEVRIGRFCVVAGLGTTFFAHGIDIKSNRLQADPIFIGDYCMIGTNCILLKGSKLPDRSILAAGSTLAHKHTEQLWIYSGVPAAPSKKLEGDFQFFHRDVGFVS